ncbi:DUF2304 domain-containing protein [Clostridium oryzae]|uniref:DUF2304 domain-containing protein n=1 Tax=Clostridium oryzae TaxID=1450648 RepID=A0A1V4IH19_9CLOT|nr:DUF2304 domain-containing protein [Clostridium oryzae]OPJ59226.1 hypothetical protein CLORY_33820 [Clostridium oryzae]
MKPYIYCFVLSVLFLIGTLYFVKKRILDFKYSIFWILISIMLIVLSLDTKLTENMARTVGIYYAPAFLFVTGIIFLLILIFYLNLVMSKMQSKITLLTQEIGMIKSYINEGEPNR